MGLAHLFRRKTTHSFLREIWAFHIPLRIHLIMQGEYTVERDPTSELITFKSTLDGAAAGKSRRSLMRRASYYFAAGKEDIYSYSVPDENQYKRGGRLPSNARGIFIRVKDGEPQIVARGYDKFFNVGEVKWVEWSSLAEQSRGPYELTLKENGCIIFIAAVDGHILVTSKHAIGGPHAEKGEEWLNKHLNSVGRTKKDLAEFLGNHNITAVFELADDEFEEHILEYPPDRAGLYLHGINHNTIKLRTWPTSQLSEFATYFGFNKVGSLVRDTVDEVKELTDACRDTGSFEGRPIEGWVVRCKVRGEDREMEDMFFKVKYDEPYLMYREWREVTRQVMRGKDFSRYRYDLTTKYVEFVKRKLKEQPKLFEGFNQNHGIIKVRNIFLEEMGIDNPERLAVRNDVEGEIVSSAGNASSSDVLEQEQNGRVTEVADAFDGVGEEDVDSPDARKSRSGQKSKRGHSKTLLVPIATIGCGKTTLAIALTELFGFGHVQNDNITKKNPMKHFADAILTEFRDHDVVIADKNNHLFEHREKLVATVRNHFPGCKVVAMDWQVDPAREKEILDVTAQRVISRGENHQSLTPGRTAEFQKILQRFIRERNPLDLTSRADKGIDQVIPLDVFSDTKTNLVAVIRALNLDMPTNEAIDAAMASAFTYTPTVVKNVDDRSGKGKKSESESRHDRATLAKYYGIRVTSPALKDELAQFFEGRQERGFWDALVKGKRVKDDFHVTLVFCGNSQEQKKLPESRIQLAKRYQALITNQSAPSPPSTSGSSGSASASGSGSELSSLDVTLTASSVVFSGRVMCIPVDLPAGIASENVRPHITVATKDDKVKPVESNYVLNDLAETSATAGNGSIVVLPFEQPLQIRGVIKAFWY
ncbi:hypothetical protein M427DRAFT_159045 [Gonapodya prolifera JEL478]|uniref:tRNA ligase n=1 Tax=Gonapodya prolifera (strain JEL478) TaxID=1344416 RepID=A0A139A1C6_GONPJ|nr:hypothetical protein M427DRAFT_159045 [Gonapodya prolifera JEL478]|eukprot:KXS10539.1 hypothetical protein M427DRAFT_159045 [Gonapodya prolifera JEL478]